MSWVRAPPAQLLIKRRAVAQWWSTVNPLVTTSSIAFCLSKLHHNFQSPCCSQGDLTKPNTFDCRSGVHGYPGSTPGRPPSLGT